MIMIINDNIKYPEELEKDDMVSEKQLNVTNVVSEDKLVDNIRNDYSKKLITDEILKKPKQLQVDNIGWSQFCELKGTNIKILNINKLLETEYLPEISENKLLIALTNKKSTELIITTPKHIFPYVLNVPFSISKFLISKNKVNGILLDQYMYDKNVGITTFVPINMGRKYYGYYTKLNQYKQYYYVSSCNESDPIILTNFPEQSPRELSNVLTDIDKIIISNASNKFQKNIEKEIIINVKDALFSFSSIMMDTVDPSYIYKLLRLNKNISFPKSRN